MEKQSYESALSRGRKKQPNKRVMERDKTSSKEVEAIIAAQPNRKDRLKDNDDLILNEGSIADLEDKWCLCTKKLTLAEQMTLWPTYPCNVLIVNPLDGFRQTGTDHFAATDASF